MSSNQTLLRSDVKWWQHFPSTVSFIKALFTGG